VFAGSFVAFFVGFLAVAVIELGVVHHKLDGLLVICLAIVTAPSGVVHSARYLKNMLGRPPLRAHEEGLRRVRA